MNDLVRLRDSAGPARKLMRGAELPVPSAARRRALAFTAAAANLAVGGTALAASGTSLVKSVALCVSLGVVGGGLASLGVSSAITSWEEPRVAAAANVATTRSSGSRRAPAAPSAVPAVAPAAPEPAVSAVTSAASGAGESPLARSAPSAGSSGPARRSLFDEQRVIEGARAAIARGDARAGLKLLDGYERGFPQGQFYPEALALRVEALSNRGDFERAKALADEFARRYSQHPLLPRVQASVARK